MYDNDNWNNFTAFRGWQGGGHRTKRGDMRPIILRLLQKKPMHGYEIISSLEEKSHGFWRPSAGSIYPNLQLLEEEELVTSELENGKKVYSLTEKGQEEAKKTENLEFKGPWAERPQHAKVFKDMKYTFVEAMTLLKQIASQDSEKKNEEVKKILVEAKDKLAKLAAEPVEDAKKSTDSTPSKTDQ